jgi:hypothetical protein
MQDHEFHANRDAVVDLLATPLSHAIAMRDSGRIAPGVLPPRLVDRLNSALEEALQLDLQRLGLSYYEMNYTDVLQRVRESRDQ